MDRLQRFVAGQDTNRPDRPPHTPHKTVKTPRHTTQNPHPTPHTNHQPNNTNQTTTQTPTPNHQNNQPNPTKQNRQPHTTQTQPTTHTIHKTTQTKPKQQGKNTHVCRVCVVFWLVRACFCDDWLWRLLSSLLSLMIMNGFYHCLIGASLVCGYSHGRRILFVPVTLPVL